MHRGTPVDYLLEAAWLILNRTRPAFLIIAGVVAIAAAVLFGAPQMAGHGRLPGSLAAISWHWWGLLGAGVILAAAGPLLAGIQSSLMEFEDALLIESRRLSTAMLGSARMIADSVEPQLQSTLHERIADPNRD